MNSFRLSMHTFRVGDRTHILLISIVHIEKSLYEAYQWIFANPLGWAAGMGWIYLAVFLPDDNTSLFVIILMGIGGECSQGYLWD